MVLSSLVVKINKKEIIVTIDPKNKEEFERSLLGEVAEIGVVTDDDFIIKNWGKEVIKIGVGRLGDVYRERFKEY